jgi:hypothetical protein
MTCAEFDLWLDQGRPAERAPEAQAHARGCARCAALLAVELEIASAFAAPLASPAAPAGFTDRVMARVAASSQTRRSFAPVPENDLPWWVFAAAEPATVLAALLAALVVWQPRAMFSAAMSLAQVIATALGQSTGVVSVQSLLGPDLAVLFTNPTARFGLMLALVPFVLWLGYQLYRWTERRTVVTIKLARSRR